MIKLLSLGLKNFKGIQNFKFDTDGKDIKIVGDNGTGKTTLVDAFIWLLFNKNSHYDTKFNIKIINPKTGKAFHKLEHTVWGKLEIDGKEIELSKYYYEKYSNSGIEEEFKGHTTDYYLNDTLVSKKDYEKKINSWIDEEKFKILTNPTYFNEKLNWKDRRKILLNLTDLDLEAILERDKYETLNKPENGVRTRIKTVKRKMRSLKDSKKDISARVMEKRRDLVDIDENLDEIEKEIKEKQQKLNAEQEKLYELKHNDYEKEINNVNYNINQIDGDIDFNSMKIDSYYDEIDNLEDKLFEIESKSWDESDEYCDSCGQHLRKDQVEEAKNNFYQNKKDKMNKFKDKINKNRKEINNYQQEIRKFIKKKEKLVEKFRELKNKAKQSDDSKIERLTKNIETLKSEISGLISKKGDININKKIRDRISELEKKETDIVRSYEKLEQEKHLLTELQNDLARDLQKELNNKFELVNFKMFYKQVNGNIKPTCKTTVDGVPYADLNTGNKINAGLDIIRTLMDYYDTYAPVMIDNRESISKVLDLNTQIINIFVEKDKELTINKE